MVFPFFRDKKKPASTFVDTGFVAYFANGLGRLTHFTECYKSHNFQRLTQITITHFTFIAIQVQCQNRKQLFLFDLLQNKHYSDFTTAPNKRKTVFTWCIKAFK
ncbi:MAG: hypothetical protein EVA22_06440 [Alteromonas sp.]|nr:MAG: hypothetical protein EVA22_06440 [Alteromonas sp.]